MGIKERKELEKLNMRKFILDSAMELFLEGGFENVSIQHIAERIEYSPATIYLYFKDKNEILYALHTIGFEKLYKYQQTFISIKDPWERLRKQGKAYITFALTNPEYYDLMFIKRGTAKKIKEKEEWGAGLRSFESLKEIIKECIDARYIAKVDLDVAAFAFWSFVHGIVSLIIRDRAIMFPRERLNSIAESSFDFMLNSMSEERKFFVKEEK